MMGVTTDDEALAEIDGLIEPIKAANPGISNGDVALHLPEHLRQPFWGRAVGRYLDAELAKVDGAGTAK